MDPIITPSEMYWLTRMDGIREVAQVMCIVFAVFAIAGLLGYVGTAIGSVTAETPTGTGQAKAAHRKLAWAFWGLLAGLVSSLAVYTFLPTTREYAAIRMVPAIINNERLRTDAAELYDLTTEWAKGQLRTKKAEVGSGQ